MAAFNGLNLTNKYCFYLGIFQMPCYMSYCASWGWWVSGESYISSRITGWSCFGNCCKKLWLLLLQVWTSKFCLLKSASCNSFKFLFLIPSCVRLWCDCSLGISFWTLFVFIGRFAPQPFFGQCTYGFCPQHHVFNAEGKFSLAIENNNITNFDCFSVN